MAKDNSGAIVILLSAILAVLLFGKDVFLANLQLGFWLIVAFALLALLWFTFKALFIDVPARLYRIIKTERDAGGPWLAVTICLIGLVVGLVWFLGMLGEHLGWRPVTDLVAIVYVAALVLMALVRFARWVIEPFRGSRQ